MSTQFRKVYACYVWKKIRDITTKLQDGYKNNAMQVNPKHKWYMEKSTFWKTKQFDAETP